MFSKELLLKLWFENEPTARSNYALYDYPPMWKTVSLEPEGLVLFTRPGKIQTRSLTGEWKEEDGVRYQIQKDGEWVSPLYGCSSEWFEARVDVQRIRNL